jgi:hypothetical protein
MKQGTHATLQFTRVVSSGKTTQCRIGNLPLDLALEVASILRTSAGLTRHTMKIRLNLFQKMAGHDRPPVVKLPRQAFVRHS